jgi:hypothetical protein
VIALQAEGPKSVSVLLAPGVEPDAVGDPEREGVEIVSLPTTGTAGLINDLRAGLEQSGGDLVCYLRRGERLYPGAVAGLARVLEHQPAAVLVYPTFVRLGTDREILETVVPDEVDAWEILRLQRSPVGPAPMMRRDAVIAALRLEADFPSLRELVFWLGIAMEGDVRRNPGTGASREASSEPIEEPAGLAGARERVAFYEHFVGMVQPPSDPRQGILSAARNAFIAGSLEIPGSNDPHSRFFVADRFAGEGVDDETIDGDARLALLEVRHAQLEQRAVRQRATLLALHELVEIRESMLKEARSGPAPEAPARRAQRLKRRLKEVRDGRR